MNPARPARLPHTSTAAVLMAVGTACFLAAALLVHTGATAWDERIFRSLNDVPSALASVLTPFAKLFLPAGLFVVIALASVYVTVRNRSGLPLLAGAAAGGAAYLLANLAKAAARRPRPYEVLVDAVLRQSPAHGTSFPSSHTAVAVGTVVALVPFLPRRLAVASAVYAALVGWSRIYLGVHFPLGVIGGAGIGLAVGVLTLLVLERILPATPPVPGDAGHAAERPPPG